MSGLYTVPSEPEEQYRPASLTFAEVSAANRLRCEKWHGEDTEPWSLGDWSNAMSGEVGELLEAILLLLTQTGAAAGRVANAIKKIRRHETATASPTEPTVAELLEEVENEGADVLLYLSCLFNELGLDLGAAVIRKFNIVSERMGFPDRLGEAA